MQYNHKLGLQVMVIYQGLKAICQELHQKKNINTPDIIVAHYHQTRQLAETLQKA